LKFLNSQYKVQYQLAKSNLDNERKKIDELLKIYGDTSSTVGKGENLTVSDACILSFIIIFMCEKR